jgi:Adaptin N terminal region
VIKDILRKYPHKYENVIVTLAENLDALDEQGARGSLIWMIGEYAEKITNAGELLETFVESFKDEPTSVLQRGGELMVGAIAVAYCNGEIIFEEGCRDAGTSTKVIENSDLRVR